MNHFCVYMVLTSANRIYTGITTDVDRRVKEHNTSKRGAKALRGQRPVKLLWYTHNSMSRSEASKWEAMIKKKSRKEKEKFVGGLKP